MSRIRATPNEGTQIRENFAAQSFGTEKRASILPVLNMSPSEFVGADQDYSAAILTPKQVGVREGNDMGSVIDAVKAMAQYGDVIGFAAPSNPLTQSLRDKLQPLGVNQFAPTSQTCPNGAQIWVQVNGIPKGDALGPYVQKALAEISPDLQLKGLGPGILEDAKTAMNPQPLVQAVIGTPQPACKQVTMRVGDSLGRMVDPNDPENVWVKGNVIVGQDGRPQQTRWVQDTNAKGAPKYVDRKTWLCTPKTLDKEGNPLASSPPLDAECTEGFTDFKKTGALVAIALLGLAVVVTSQRK